MLILKLVELPESSNIYEGLFAVQYDANSLLPLVFLLPLYAVVVVQNGRKILFAFFLLIKK